MTERLRDAFTDLLQEEPLMHVTTDEIVGRGRHLRRRRRIAVRGGSGLAVAAAVFVGLTLAQGHQDPHPATTSADYPIPAGAVFVSPTGSDTAAGTKAAPLRTVAKAVAEAPAGGTVVLRAGSYRESLTIAKKITIQSYDGETATLDGTDVTTAWTPDGTAWRATGYTSPFCQNCFNATAVNAAHPAAGSPDQVFVNGTPLTQVTSRDAVTTGTFYVDPTTKQLYLGTNPAGRTVQVSTRWLAVKLEAGAAGSKLLGLHFFGYSDHWNEDQQGVIVDQAPNSLIENDTITRSANKGLGVYAAGVTVQGNTVDDNGGPGGSFNRADDVVVKDNHFDGNNAEHWATEANYCGAYCTMAGLKIAHTSGMTISGNTFDGNDGSGFWCDLGCTSGTITGNRADDNTVNGLFWEVSSHATVTGNTMTGNAQGLKISGSDHVTATGNAFQANTIQVEAWDDARSSSTDAYSAGKGLTWNTTNTVLSGNTFGGTSTLLLHTNDHQVGAAQMFTTLAGNTVATGSAQKIWWCPTTSCTTYTTLAAFHTGTGLPFGTVGGPVATPTATPTSPPTAPAPTHQPTPKPTATVTPKRQYLTDPTFTAATSGWSTFGPATTLTRTPGLLAIKATGTVSVAGATGADPSLVTAAGHRYVATCRIRSDRGINAEVQMQEYTQGWQRVADPVRTRVATVAGQWYQVTLAYTARTTGNRLPMAVISGDLYDGRATLYVSGCSLTDG